MIRLTRTLIVLSVAVIISAVTGRASMAQAPANKACALVTAAELQSALGSKVTLTAGSLGNVQTCTGGSAGATVSVRFLTTSKASPASEG